ncbi:type 1 glutamine amidotransferase domain-containing protein [Lentzea sp. BCCO 10_0856]|uniref:Type 1 glutamine amidotransferase domain-containing protein n=1 Tax=Lentzea miocenica TaxID=3095431 RepID=A0ABU4SWE6_9PSEU|nr:type 1 glutamine amidotransferase domain-containing protein [Lentzea sp. BCCO 10_0856]MDX8030068.1 type 1 glutamine amidotransferase domain-containing protein [Lentzea sp. BCCO 10_0856]
MKKLLMVVTGADSLTLADGTNHPTGFWAEEVVESVRVLREAGVEVTVATPGGVVPTVDKASLDGRFDDAVASLEDLRAPATLASMKAADFDAIYLPGGHGPMTDLAFDQDLGTLLADFHDSGKLVAALCHGPAGLLSAVRADGTFVFAGKELTVFSDEEERIGGLDVPYLVAGRLAELGARVTPGEPWSNTVVVDGRFVTGQNPQSTVATATQVAALI